MISPPNPAMERRVARLGRRAATAILTAAWLTACSASPEEMLASAKGYLEKNDTDAAEIQLKNALQQNGNLTEARYLLGKLYFDQGDAEGAAKELRRAAELGYPAAAAMPLWARAMLRSSDYDGVIREFSARTLDDPAAQAQLLAALGDAHLGKGDMDKARAAYTAATQANPADPLSRVGMARTRLLGGDAKGALAEVDGLLAEHPLNGDALVLRADALVALGRLDDAAAAMSKAVETSPREIAYHFTLISLLLRQDKFEEAAAALQAMKKMAPNHVSTRYLQAFLDFRNERVDQARDGVLRVLKMAPDFVPAQLLAGTIFLRLNDQAQAQLYLGKVLSRAPDQLLARRLMAQSLLVSGEPARAQELVEPLLRIAPDDAGVQSLAGQIYLANGDFARASEHFGRAVKSDPEDADARTRLGLARLAAGDAERAFLDLETASKLASDDLQADAALILAHVKRGEFDKALAAQQRLERKQPNLAQTHNLKAGILVAKGDVAGGRAAFEHALSIDRDSFAAVISLARLDLAAKKTAEAQQRLEDFIKRNPNHQAALLALADVKRVGGSPSAEVISVLERAAQANPTAVGPKLALIRQHLRDGDSKRALAIAQDAAAANPKDAQALAVLGEAQLAAGDVQQSIGTYQKLVALQPRSPAPLVELSDAYVKANDTAAAEQTLRKAISLKPDFIPARQRLIALLVTAKRNPEAVTVARELQRVSPKLPNGYVFEGEVQGVAGAWEESAAAFRKGLELEPTPLIAAKLHLALVRAGKAQEAEKMAADWLAAHPRDVVLRAQLVQYALADKRYKDADRILRKMLEIAPDNALVLNNLAWVAGQLKDPEAITYARKALERAPDNPAILDTLGTLQVSSGQAEQGLQNQRKAVELAPKLSGLRLNLAKSYLQLERKDEARKELDIVLSEAQAGTPVHAEASRLRQGL